MEFILRDCHFDDSVTNPYLVAYLKSANKQIGDECKPYEYLSWIQTKLLNFKKVHNINETESIDSIPNGRTMFIEFLNA